MEQLDKRLDRIELRLDALNEHLQKHPLCPAPGSCVEIRQGLDRAFRSIEGLERRLEGLDKWRAWLTGALAIVGPLAVIFLPRLAERLGF